MQRKERDIVEFNNRLGEEQASVGIVVIIVILTTVIVIVIIIFIIVNIAIVIIGSSSFSCNAPSVAKAEAQKPKTFQ